MQPLERPPLLHRRWLIPVTLVAGAIGACSQDQPIPPERSGSNAARQFPPGAAAALSLGSAASLPQSDRFNTAATCSAALQVTNRFLEARAAELPAGAMETLRKAVSYFQERAIAEARSKAIDNPEALIEQRKEEAEADPAAQLRIAMACLQTVSSQ